MAAPLHIADLEFRHAIIQAPMSEGVTTPELVAAIAAQGAVGSLAAGYMTPADIIEHTHHIRACTSAPFALNLFIPPRDAQYGCDMDRARQALKPCYAAAGVPMPEELGYLPEFEDQFEAMLAVQPAIFSFTFGILDQRHIKACRARNIALVGTATSVFEANGLAHSGVDAIVLQGEEAGGHCGSHNPHGQSQPLNALLRACRSHIDLPLIAAGGLMSAMDVRRARQNGADGAQCGTAFLLADEAGTPYGWRCALKDAGQDATEITIAASGRLARGLRNAWMSPRAPRDIAPWPWQALLTAPLRHQTDYLEWKNLWAGSRVHHITTGSAASLLAALCR